MKDYAVPPIVEAVINVHFEEGISFPDIEKHHKKFLKHYGQVDTEFSIEGEIDQKGNLKQNIRAVGLKLSSDNQQENLILRQEEMAVFQLAPYGGWTSFFKRFKRDWALHKKCFGRKRIVRVGVRYVNRIDTFATRAVAEDYILLLPQVPLPDFATGINFAMNTLLKVPDRPFYVRLGSATVPSPVPNALCFLLDIDLFTMEEMPTSDETLFQMLDLMRILKNEVFENCITENARETFNNVNDPR